MSSHEFEALLASALRSPGAEGRNLGKLLALNGFSADIVDLTLSEAGESNLGGMQIDGVRFSRCKFNGTRFTHARISGCTFHDCEFQDASFVNSRLKDCRFEGCGFSRALLVGAELDGIDFDGGKLDQCSFEDAQLDQVAFRGVRLPETHFLDATVASSSIADSDLTDTVFLGCDASFSIDEPSKETARITRPTVATLVSLEARGVSVPLVGRKLTEVAGVIPICVAMQSPTVGADETDREVEAFLDGSPAAPGATHDSPARRLVQAVTADPHAFPNAAVIARKAATLARHVNAVVLPGGEDVSPKLYGAARQAETRWQGDYRRSLLELALIHQSFHRGIPLMAICRGFQMTSVHFGGRLVQHVGDDQVGVRSLARDTSSESATERLGQYGTLFQHLRSAVYHHQALPVDSDIKHIVPSLTQVVEDSGRADPEDGTRPRWQIVMAIESEAGAPIFGLQFHPEFVQRHPSELPPTPPSDAELRRLAREFARPGSADRGLRNPRDMVDSGILVHASPANDDLWKMLSTAAAAQRARSGIDADALSASLERLRPDPKSAFSMELAALRA